MRTRQYQVRNWRALLLVGGLAAAAACAAPATAAVPDDRAIELVSISDKNQNQVEFATLAPSGDHLLYSVIGGTAGSPSGFKSYFFADRTATGWRSTAVLPPRTELDLAGFTPRVPNAAVDRVAVLMRSARLGGTGDILMRFGADEMPFTYHQFPLNAGALQAMFGSTDLTVIAGVTTNQWAPDHLPVGSLQLYSYDGGAPALIGRLPGPGGPADPVPACGARFAVASNARPSGHQISTDGSRAFFHSRPGATCTSANPWQLYVRRGGLSGATTLISGPALDGVEREAQFVQATADGSEVFFATAAQLTPDDTDANGDVYRYTVDTGTRTCVTCTAPAPADVPLGNVGSGDLPRVVVARDGSRLYFATPSVLLPGEGIPAQQNVYRIDVATGTLRYVATIGAGELLEDSYRRGTAITTDGSTLLFRAGSPELDRLTGSPNGGVQQYYRYDAESETVTCVSCPALGLATSNVTTDIIDRGMFALDIGSPMSEDGRIIAFRTSDPLVPQDVNGSDDVYEWRDGTVRLLTDGLSRFGVQNENKIFGVSPSGRDILFATGSKLSPEVSEGDAPSRQLYMARIGGGFPQAPEHAECAGDQCQGPPTPAPLLPRAGSTVFTGPGNVEVEENEPFFRVGALTATQRARWARRGRVTLLVRVSDPGRVAAVVRGKIGKRVRAVARVRRSAATATTVRLPLRLSTRARRQLQRNHALRLSIAVSYSGESDNTQRATLTLRLPKRR